MKCRFDACDRVNPISLKDIDDSNEWLMGQMEELDMDELVSEDDNLTCNMVVEAIGVEEEAYNTRSSKETNVAFTHIPRSMAKEKGKAPSTKAPLPIIEEEDDDEDIDFEYEYQEEDGEVEEDEEDYDVLLM